MNKPNTQNTNKKNMEAVTPKSEDISRWYTDVVLKARMADYSPVKGCMIIRPYGYALWENIQKILDAEFKRLGHQNAYFPMFIPESFLTKEAEHVEGFAPEVAWVTHGGSEELEERLAIRPTSEAIIGHMYAKWIESYRDLPVLINQWANVVRWEKVTRPFLRTTEFLWQEGHTAHRTHEEACEEVMQMLGVYRKFVEGSLAIPLVTGEKSQKEKFAGALNTYTIEALMPDGQALQSGTSHDLGQNFAKAFDIRFLDSDGERKYAWTTSWGMSTRIIGAAIMVHGDDRGLRLPPKVAPIQAVVIPIVYKDSQDVIIKARELMKRLAACDIRVHLDDREGFKPGWKYSEYEMMGVPLRVEIGQKDLEKNQVCLVRRDTGEKMFVPDAELETTVQRLMEEIQQTLFNQAAEILKNKTVRALTFAEFVAAIKEKQSMADLCWCGSLECEAKFKAEAGATIRCFNDGPVDTACVVCGKPAQKRVFVARAY
ncbi:MAG: proline--tRNA ligase [Candidatus Riflebacteria bacterium HGW-Riflebacteria-2]|jgi:prolyl-tRNA synthetase|nr:MAG: proline--tRNA ligase [Candidatus Riflebacteria bacterium HGW-Riflebacteria-2]